MQTIYLDISNKGVIPCIQAKQSEVGRKFLAVITDNGVPYNIPNDALLSVWYEGDTDAGNYSSIEEKSAFIIDGNKVSVELVAQMLLKPGKGELCLSISHGDGGETNTWNIPYEVEYKPGAGSAVPTEYYTALTDAASRAAEKVGLAAEQAEIASEKASEAAKSAENAQNAAKDVLIENRVLIWENANPSGSFAAQTIDADVSKYSKIELLDWFGNVFYFSTESDKASSITGSYITGSTMELWSRNVSISDDGISITDCNMAFYRSSQWGFELANGRLKPYKIYGISY